MKLETKGKASTKKAAIADIIWASRACPPIRSSRKGTFKYAIQNILVEEADNDSWAVVGTDACRLHVATICKLLIPELQAGQHKIIYRAKGSIALDHVENPEMYPAWKEVIPVKRPALMVCPTRDGQLQSIVCHALSVHATCYNVDFVGNACLGSNSVQITLPINSNSPVRIDYGSRIAVIMPISKPAENISILGMD